MLYPNLNDINVLVYAVIAYEFIREVSVEMPAELDHCAVRFELELGDMRPPDEGDVRHACNISAIHAEMMVMNFFMVTPGCILI